MGDYLVVTRRRDEERTLLNPFPYPTQHTTTRHFIQFPYFMVPNQRCVIGDRRRIPTITRTIIRQKDD